MYLWSIILISAMAAIAGFALGQFPYPLILSIVICAAAELLITRFWLKRDLKIPFSGVITGLIIGVVAPINAPFLAVLIAGMIAILSKFFIKVRSSNLFNPAALGLIIALAIFSIGDSWWISTSITFLGVVLILTPILIVLAYFAKRLHLALASLLTVVVLTLIISGNISLTGLAVGLLSINYFFIFVMLVEPKTSPPKAGAQVVYGVGMMLFYYLLIALKTPYPAFAALLAGNIVYGIYRYRGGRLV
jgi:Na+-translocating ferredoxin:NAD+ oxidoreductase RnfD subunit